MESYYKWFSDIILFLSKVKSAVSLFLQATVLNKNTIHTNNLVNTIKATTDDI